jgi:hypothetical protein
MTRTFLVRVYDDGTADDAVALTLQFSPQQIR